MYEIYLDGTRLPVSPDEIEIEVEGQNKTVNLINGEQMNLIRNPALHKISFKALLPYQKYPFVRGDFLSVNEYLDYLESIMKSLKPIDLQILCIMPDNKKKYEYNHKVTLEGYSITESVDLGMDTEVDLEFLQYIPHSSQRASIMNFYVGKKYKIKEGDTLEKIAKKKMGDDEYIAENAKEIYRHNKKIIDFEAHHVGLKSLKGKNLVVGTYIIIPWHVQTPKEDRYKLTELTGGVAKAKATKGDKSTDKVKKKKQTTVTSNSGKKTSDKNVKKVKSTPTNLWTDLWGNGYSETLSNNAHSTAVTVTDSNGKQHTVYR